MTKPDDTEDYKHIYVYTYTYLRVADFQAWANLARAWNDGTQSTMAAAVQPVVSTVVPG